MIELEPWPPSRGPLCKVAFLASLEEAAWCFGRREGRGAMHEIEEARGRVVVYPTPPGKRWSEPLAMSLLAYIEQAARAWGMTATLISVKRLTPTQRKQAHANRRNKWAHPVETASWLVGSWRFGRAARRS